NGLIDWTRSAEQICNQIRAMQPWPTAYTFFHGENKPPVRILVTKATTMLANDHEAVAMPGHPTQLSKLVVRAGDRSVVEIVELQPAGKKRMSAEEFLRGHPIRVSDFFGPEKPGSPA